jgi:hypothetical protein
MSEPEFVPLVKRWAGTGREKEVINLARELLISQVAGSWAAGGYTSNYGTEEAIRMPFLIHGDEVQAAIALAEDFMMAAYGAKPNP